MSLAQIYSRESGKALMKQIIVFLTDTNSITLFVRWHLSIYIQFQYFVKGKGKAVPLQAWSGPEASRKLRFPDFMTTAQDGGKVVSLSHRPPLPQEIHLVLISVRG